MSKREEKYKIFGYVRLNNDVRFVLFLFVPKYFLSTFRLYPSVAFWPELSSVLVNHQHLEVDNSPDSLLNPVFCGLQSRSFPLWFDLIEDLVSSVRCSHQRRSSFILVRMRQQHSLTYTHSCAHVYIYARMRQEYPPFRTTMAQALIPQRWTWKTKIQAYLFFLFLSRSLFASLRIIFQWFQQFS